MAVHVLVGGDVDRHLQQAGVATLPDAAMRKRSARQ